MFRRLQKAWRTAAERYRTSSLKDKTTYFLVSLYIALTAAFLVWNHAIMTPDQFFVWALVLSVLLRRAVSFLWDWIPLLLLLLGYDYVRGFAPLINSNVHYLPMIEFDRLVFGSVPTIALQTHFYDPATPHWYDYAAAVLYFLHFIMPLGTAFVFWLRDNEAFRKYSAGILTLSYMAFLTYLAFPAAPPWLAAQAGYLPAVQRVLADTLMQFSDPISLPTLYSRLGVNVVAAVPSLHAAYPLITALFIRDKLPKLWPLLALYVVSVWMAIIYLGEHYAFDVCAGILYAGLAYGLVNYWPAIKQAMTRRERVAVEVPTLQ